MTSEQTLAGVIDSLSDRKKAAVIRMTPQGQTTSFYPELAEDALALARGLCREKKEKSRFGLLAEPAYEGFAAALGIIRAGMTVVPMDLQIPDEGLQTLLADSGTGLVFTTEHHVQRLKNLAPGIEVACLDVPETSTDSWRRLFDRHTPLPDIAPQDEAALFYTSGTTGPPKGVPLSHANLMFQLDTVAGTGFVTPGDTVLLPLPLHHVYPFVIGMLIPFSMGLTVVLPQSLTGPQILRALSVGKVSVIIGVPRLYEALFTSIRSKFKAGGRPAQAGFDTALKLSGLLWRNNIDAGRLVFTPLRRQIGASLKILGSGGSPLNPCLARNLAALGWEIAIGYGLTETSPLLTINPPGSRNLESIGRPIEGVELRFDKDAVPEDQYTEKKPLPRDRGELLAKGPGVFSGYLNLQEKTREAFSDGWYRTGDLGFRDEKGYIYITGRKSTLIITPGGENIQPDQVEDRLAGHPTVREAGVLQKDSKLVALLVPDFAQIGTSEPDAVDKAVKDAVSAQSEKLPSYQQISDFAVTRDPLARTRIGKIRRHLLADHFDEAKQGKGTTPETGPMPLEKMTDQDQALLGNRTAWQVWQWLGDQYPGRYLTPDTDLRLELDIDSLAWLNLTMELSERFGVALSDEAVGRITVVRDLLREITENGQQHGSPVSLDDPEKSLSRRQKRFLQPQGPVAVKLATALSRVNRCLATGFFNLTVEGRENIPRDPVVFTPNHVSYLDPFVLAAALDDEQLLGIYWAGFAGVAFHNRVNASVSRLAKTIPIDPRKGVSSALTAAAAALRRGHSLVWFPEGARSPTGRLQSFKTGIGTLLSHHDIPVVPVFISGTADALPMGRTVPVPSRITVRFGPPVRPGLLDRQGKGDNLAERITDALHRRVAATDPDTEAQKKVEDL